MNTSISSIFNCKHNYKLKGTIKIYFNLSISSFELGAQKTSKQEYFGKYYNQTWPSSTTPGGQRGHDFFPGGPVNEFGLRAQEVDVGSKKMTILIKFSNLA